MVSWTDDTEDTILFFIIQWLDQRNWGIKISQNSWTVTLGPVSFEQPARRCQKPSTWACMFRTPLAGGTQGAEEPFLTPFSTGWEHSKAQSLAHLWISGLMPKRQRRLNVSLWPRNRWRGTPPSLAGVSSPCLSLLLLMQVSPIAMVCPYTFNLVQGEPFFVAFADFCSVNTPTMADVCGVNTPTMPIWSYQHDVTEHRAGKKCSQPPPAHHHSNPHTKNSTPYLPSVPLFQFLNDGWKQPCCCNKGQKQRRTGEVHDTLLDYSGRCVDFYGFKQFLSRVLNNFTCFISVQLKKLPSKRESSSH